MNYLNKITAVLIISIYFVGSCTFAQSEMLAYNDGLDSVAVQAGLTVTIQGGYTSQRNSGVDGQIDNQGTINISGDFVNNNVASPAFSTSAGLVNLNSTVATQAISGTYDPGFYNLTLDNTYATSPQYTLNVNTNVKNTLTMTAGNVNLGSNSITLGISAVSPGTLAYSSGWMYGAGNLIRWFGTSTISLGAVAGHFPIGSSNEYRPLYVGASIAPTTGGTISLSHTNVINAATVSFNDVDLVPIVRVTNSYWTSTTGNGLAGGTYDLRIEGTGLGAIGNVNDLRVTLAAAAAGGLVGANAGTNANPQVNRTGLTVANLSNPFRIGSKDATQSPLPIQLLTFNGLANGNVVDLKWTTATETNNNYFTVERSADGNYFSSISIVPGAGNSSRKLNYSTVDRNPLQGVSYYRLKQTDFDGKYSYSQIVSVNFNSSLENLNLFTIYPNPATADNQFFLNFSKVNKSQNVFVVVNDVNGKKLFSTIKILEQGDNRVVAIDPENKLPSGIYIVSATSDDIIFRTRLIIK